MPRRVSLPSADDLFRPTEDGEAAPARAVRAVPDAAADRGADQEAAAGQKKPSGRVKHDEKITVYVTAGELLELEQARLTLRARHGLAVDRGRLVREALGMVLADLEDRGGESALVARLAEG